MSRYWQPHTAHGYCTTTIVCGVAGDTGRGNVESERLPSSRTRHVLLRISHVGDSISAYGAHQSTRHASALNRLESSDPSLYSIYTASQPRVDSICSGPAPSGSDTSRPDWFYNLHISKSACDPVLFGRYGNRNQAEYTFFDIPL